jgi:hypothetical protein
MSRSYRRPYAAITGNASAKQDKRMAHRGVRRNQKLALSTCEDYENLLLPHRLECAWNNTYVWGRDGSQLDYSRWRYSEDEWCQRYYRELVRK